MMVSIRAHALGWTLLAASLAFPVSAQTPPDPAKVQACQAASLLFRQAAVAVSQQAADVSGALTARAGLAPKEADARAACTPLGFHATVPIDIAKEDLDIALARKVPACNVFLDQAGKHIAVAPKLRENPGMAHEAAKDLRRIRDAAAEGCKDYRGATARMYRVELDLTLVK
jgi:hypothetical protein